MHDRLRDRLRGDTGSSAPLLIGIIVVMAILAGIGFDFIGHAAAQERLRASTDQAARAAGNSLDRAAIVQGTQPHIDMGQAMAAAQTELSAQGVAGTVTLASPTTVHVETSGTYQCQLLRFAGITSLPLHASANSITTRTMNGQPR